MISQMNVVQNAARLAMDHRAARPMRGYHGTSRRSMILATVCAAVAFLLFTVAYLLAV